MYNLQVAFACIVSVCVTYILNLRRRVAQLEVFNLYIYRCDMYLTVYLLGFFHFIIN